MMEHLNFRAIPISRRRSRVKCLTHTLLRVVIAWERIFDNQGETERFNGPKSVVGPYDKIRRAGKARRVESLSFSKNRYENFMKFSQHIYRKLWCLIYTHIHIHTYIYIYTYIHRNMHTDMHICCENVIEFSYRFSRNSKIQPCELCRRVWFHQTDRQRS